MQPGQHTSHCARPLLQQCLQATWSLTVTQYLQFLYREHRYLLTRFITFYGTRQSGHTAPLPVLHTSLVRDAILQHQTVHSEEVLHVADLGGGPLLPLPLDLSVVRGPGPAQALVRVVAADPAPDALAVRHGQHPATCAAAAFAHANARLGDLQIFGMDIGFEAEGPPSVPPCEHPTPQPSPDPPTGSVATVQEESWDSEAGRQGTSLNSTCSPATRLSLL